MNHQRRRIWVIALLVGACTASPTATSMPSTGQSSTAPSASAPASASPVPTTTPEATQAPAAATTAWTEAFSRDGARVGALIVGPDGFIAAGCDVEPEDSFCTRNFVLSSPDGATWTLTDMPIRTDFGDVLRLVGGRLFWLGYGNYFADDFAGGAIVASSTDGRTWTRVESASFRDRAVNDIVETSFGSFAVGYEAPIGSDNTSGFLLWPIHADGTLGKPRSIDTEGRPPLVSGATWLGGELFAWGGTEGPYGGPPIVMASKDGVDWKVRSTIADAVEADISDITGLGDRLVAVGNDGGYYPLRPIAWFSDDRGRTWQRANVDGSDSAMFAVSVEQGRLVARGRTSYGESSRPTSWESTDGETWTRLPDDADLPNVLGFNPFTRVTVGGRTCVAGGIASEDRSRAAIFCR